jgi:hypothetical protein
MSSHSYSTLLHPNAVATNNLSNILNVRCIFMVKYQVSHTQNTTTQNLREGWEAKRLRGQIPRRLDEGLIDKEQSYR